jgi:glycerol transport system permease protein
MDKTVNQKAWFLVLPVFLVVAFSAILPLMTVVNYSMQDTFGNNQFFWNGVSWFKELLDPTSWWRCRCRVRAGPLQPASSPWRCRC